MASSAVAVSGDGQPSGTSDAALEQLMAAAATLGIVLSDGQATKLLAYRDLLLRWNRVYNLTALRNPEEVLSHHLADCLAVVPSLERHAVNRPMRVLDVGSGGGLPGVVLAVMRPDWQLTCVDTVAKKAAFVRQAAAELQLSNLNSVHARVESLVSSEHARATPATRPPGAGQAPNLESPGFDLITSRAFASLSDFASLTNHLLGAGGVWAAMKGKPADGELIAVPADVDVFHVEPLQVPGLDVQRCLVWMRPRAVI